MLSLRKMNQPFVFLLIFLLIIGFNPMLAWSEPYQTDQNTDGSNLSIDQSIRNSERVSDFINSANVTPWDSPISQDVTVHLGDGSVTFRGTTQSPDFNSFVVSFGDGTGQLQMCLHIYQRGSDLLFSGGFNDEEAGRPDRSLLTIDGNYKIGSNGDFEIIIPFDETLNISWVTFSITNEHGNNTAVFDRVNPNAAEPTDVTSIQQNPLETPFSGVDNAFTGEANRPELNRILTSTDFPEPIETTGLMGTKEFLNEKIGLETWQDFPLSHSVDSFKPMILKAAEGFMNYSRLDPLNIKALLDQAMERTELKGFSPLIEMVSKIMDLIPNQLRGILKTLFQFFEGLQEKIYQKHLLALRPYYESLWLEVLKPLQSLLQKFGILLPEKPELQEKVSKEEITWMQAMDQVMKKIIYLYQKNSLPQGIRNKLAHALSREAELYQEHVAPLNTSYESEIKNSLIEFLLKLKEKILIKPNLLRTKNAETTEILIRFG